MSAPAKKRAAKRPAAKRGAGVRGITGTIPQEEKGLELHETEPEALLELINQYPEFFGTPRFIFEPCCGPGAIVEILADMGHCVLAADIGDYESRWKASPLIQPHWGRDFFSWTEEEFLKPDAIVMNPPYSKADAFIAHGLVLAPRVFALVELPWLSGIEPLRCRLVDDGHLVAHHPFRNRLKMHRDGYDGPTNKNTRRHMWVVLDREPSPGRVSVMRRLTIPRKGRRNGS